MLDIDELSPHVRRAGDFADTAGLIELLKAGVPVRMHPARKQRARPNRTRPQACEPIARIVPGEPLAWPRYEPEKKKAQLLNAGLVFVHGVNGFSQDAVAVLPGYDKVRPYRAT